MKKFISLPVFSVLLFLLSSCGGSSDSNQADSSSGSKDVRATMRDYMRVETELQTFLSENGLGDDPEIAAMEMKAFQASRAFTETRKNHPDLKALFEEDDALKNKMISAKVDGNDELYDQTMKEYTSIRAKIESLSRDLPEIQEAQQELQEIQDEQLELIASKIELVNAEGKKIAEEYRKLHAQFKNMR